MPKQRFKTRDWLYALAFALFFLVLAGGVLVPSYDKGASGPRAQTPVMSAAITTTSGHSAEADAIAVFFSPGLLQTLLLVLMGTWLLLAVPRLGTSLSATGTAALLLLLLAADYHLHPGAASWQGAGLAVFSISGYGLLWQRRSQQPARAAEQSSAQTLTGSTTSAADSEDPPAIVLGRYRIEQSLGKGSMGVVYRACDLTRQRTVAIKTLVLSRQFEADGLEEAKARLLRECEAVSRLHHPNIVALIEAGEDAGFACLVMEFVAGGDLTRFTWPGSLLPVQEVLQLMADAADALDHAHRHDVVHRDIKPANLLLPDDSPTIKLTDFGIVSIDGSGKAGSGPVLGTPSYMSPEQLARKKVDGRSDLFSLGVTLYQLLTGALPFQAESMATLMFKIANETHTSPLILRPDLPPAVAAVIDKALAKSYEYRYQQGADMARDLRGLLQALQTGSPTATAQA